MSQTLACAAIGILSILLWLVIKKEPAKPLPPGPGFLKMVLGKVFSREKITAWVQYHQWARALNSDIIHLSFANTSIMVLDTHEATTEILEKSSGISACRPRFPMLEMMGWNVHFGLLPYGEAWRAHRRVFHNSFNDETSVREIVPMQTKATLTCLSRLLTSPEEFELHIRHLNTSLIVLITYGMDIRSSNDPYVTLADDALDKFSQGGLPDNYWVNLFPVLEHLPSWFPGAGFKRQASAWKNLTMEMADKPFAAAKKHLLDGSAMPSMVSRCLSDIQPGEDVLEKERVVRNVAVSAYAAGADTISSAMMTFMLAIVLFPSVQIKARKELDRVCGGHLPTLEDRSSLPYIEAIVREVLRWQPVTPVGGVHKTTQETNYRGYHIPAGTILLGNVWSILHDPSMYPEPEVFNPDRFMKDGLLDPSVRDPLVAYGFGRRMCPGRFVASSSLWLFVASILSVFDISRVAGSEQPKLNDEDAYADEGILCRPKSFPCTIRPRSDAAVSLIRSSSLE